MIDLHGKVVLVTGASRGIGRATALLLARAGADVAVTCRSRVAEAEAVAVAVRKLGRKAWVGAGELGDAAVVDRLFADATDALGPLGAFVGNAGIWPAEDVPLRAMGVERWRSTMRANLDAIFFTTRAALRHMTPGGAVVRP